MVTYEQTRFAAVQVHLVEGGRGPSALRLAKSTSSLPSVSRNLLFGSRGKNLTIDEGNLARHAKKQMEEPSAEVLKAAHGVLCYVCGTETHGSGSGLRQCPECHSIQLKSGGMSHAYGMSHDENGLSTRSGSKLSTRASSKRSAVEQKKQEDDIPMDAGMSGLSGLAARRAWRGLSQNSQGDSALDLVPILAGTVLTGYFVGDRVKSNLRLAGASTGGLGWDPINVGPEEGTVQGPGLKSGELMVKFDSSGVICSMKMSHIDRVKGKGSQTNVQRKFKGKPLARLTTL